MKIRIFLTAATAAFSLLGLASQASAHPHGGYGYYGYGRSYDRAIGYAVGCGLANALTARTMGVAMPCGPVVYAAPVVVVQPAYGYVPQPTVTTSPSNQPGKFWVCSNGPTLANPIGGGQPNCALMESAH